MGVREVFHWRLISGHQAGVRGSLVRGRRDPTPERGLKDTASREDRGHEDRGREDRGRNLGSERQSKKRCGCQVWGRRAVTMRRTN